MNLITAPLFGSKHLIGLVYVVVLVIVGIILLKKDYNKKNVLILTGLFYLFEIIKIIYMMWGTWTYPMNHLPLHLCSFPLYIWPILYFVKDDSRFEKYALATAFVTVLGGALAALIQPGNIIGSVETWAFTKDNFLPWVSFTYHGIMILSSVFLLQSGKYKPEFTDVLRAALLTFAFMSIALIVNFTMDKDYMLLKAGNGSPFQFILTNNGQLAYTLFMIAIGLFFIGFISIITTTIYRLGEKK